MVYIVSYKERRECSGYSNVVSGSGDIVKEDNQEASFKGELPVRDTLVLCDWEPYNPVGRNKLPKKSKRDKKNTRATYYYQSDSIKKKLFIRKRNSYVKCNEGKRQKNSTKESHKMG